MDRGRNDAWIDVALCIGWDLSPTPSYCFIIYVYLLLSILLYLFSNNFWAWVSNSFTFSSLSFSFSCMVASTKGRELIYTRTLILASVLSTMRLSLVRLLGFSGKLA